MTKALAAAVLAAAVALTAGASARGAGAACPATNHPNELVLVGGSGQTAQLGKQFGSTLQVELANSNGCALTGNVAGVTVEFDAPSSGAGGIFASTGTRIASVGTDSQGVATSPPFVANFTTGDYGVVARSSYGNVTFGLTNTASGLPSSISASSGSGQQASAGTEYAQPLQAHVTDADGDSVQGAAVTFTVLPGETGAGGAFLGAATVQTDSSGTATAPPLLANASAGRFTVTASTDGLSAVATFDLDNHAAPMTVAVTGPADPAGKVEAAYAQPLRVHVADATGAPVEGASVAFGISPSSTGAGATFAGGAVQATVLTDADGDAASPQLTAGKVSGSFTATAAVAGAPAAVFTLTNVAGRAASVVVGAADGSSATVGTRFATPLAVTVTDADGNPVKGATVVFTAPAHGASGHFRKSNRRAHARTNAKGIAVAPRLTANAGAGGFAVLVTVKGAPAARAAFALVDLPR
jgi:hypothetical protein